HAVYFKNRTIAPTCRSRAGSSALNVQQNKLRYRLSQPGFNVFSKVSNLPVMPFKLTSRYKPTGDQPQAIEQLVSGIEEGEKSQVRLGVTGAGKTFTMANVIQAVDRPTLVLTHNKTLTAQLYSEFCEFFPDNAVEYFVSYYDYYQPEAYLSVSDTYIEKDLS